MTDTWEVIKLKIGDIVIFPQWWGVGPIETVGEIHSICETDKTVWVKCLSGNGKGKMVNVGQEIIRMHQNPIGFKNVGASL